MPKAIRTYRPRESIEAAKSRRRQYDRNRRAAGDAKFYHSARWLKVRLVVLRGEPLCRLCREAGKLVEARHVDHIVPLREAPELGLDPDNLRPLCPPCHNRVRREQGIGPQGSK